MNNPKILLNRFALILLICILTRVAFLGFALQKNGWNTPALLWQDSIWFYNSAKHLADNHGYLRVLSSGKISGAAVDWHVPLYHVLLSILFAVFGPSIMLAIFINIFLFCLSAYLFYKIGTDIFGEKAGWGWFVFNGLTLIFIGFVYCTSFFALSLLFIRKRYMELFSFVLIIAYFLTAYYFYYNSRYFISIVPFLVLLSGYFISNIQGLTKKEDKVVAR